MAKLTIRRDRIRTRELLRAGRLSGVPVTAGMALGSPNDLPAELFFGLLAVWAQEENPALSYDDVLDMFDGQEIDIVFGPGAGDPKPLASVVAANGSS